MRVSPLFELSMTLRLAVIGLGLVSALYAAITERVQTDVKSALAFASLTQVGVIVVEIGLGLNYIALIHMIGHACLRTLQLLRAPTLLRDYHMLENAIGAHLTHGPTFWERVLPEQFANLVLWPGLRTRLSGWRHQRTDRVSVPRRSFAGATRWNIAGPTSSPAASRVASGVEHLANRALR